jgi:DNA-binding beta-propeller fold protein YncE
VYLSDCGNNRVRMVAPDGTITTVAGSSTRCGFSGDGGPATEAVLCRPEGLALDQIGNLYIVDGTNHVIRVVSLDGTITTFAWDGTPGFSGDGGPATAAQLRSPRDMAIGVGGNVYVTDFGNSRVRLVDSEGQIHTFSGTGKGPPPGDGEPATDVSIGLPHGVTLDAEGNVYITDRSTCSVLRVLATDQTLERVIGDGRCGFSWDGGAATQARLDSPRGVGLDSDGRLYVADSSNHRVRVVEGGIIRTFAGRAHLSGDGGPATEATLDGPSDCDVDLDGNLLIADTENAVIRRVDSEGEITTFAGTGVRGLRVGVPAGEAQMFSPLGVVGATDGSVFISDGSRRVLRVDPEGTLDTFAGNGKLSTGEEEIPATDAAISLPRGMAMDDTGNLFIADQGAGSGAPQVIQVSPDNILHIVAGSGQRGFSGDGGPAREAEVDSVRDVALDSEQRPYISGWANNRVRRVGPGGNIETVVGGGDQLVEKGLLAVEAFTPLPSGLTFDHDGNLLFALESRNQVLRLEPDGTLTIIAGVSASRGFGGDGGPERRALLDSPGGLASDEEGNLYVADTGNHRIRNPWVVNDHFPRLAYRHLVALLVEDSDLDTLGGLTHRACFDSIRAVEARQEGFGHADQFLYGNPECLLKLGLE